MKRAKNCLLQKYKNYLGAEEYIFKKYLFGPRIFVKQNYFSKKIKMTFFSLVSYKEKNFSENSWTLNFSTSFEEKKS